MHVFTPYKIIQQKIIGILAKIFKFKSVQIFENSHAVAGKRQNVAKQIKHFDSKMQQWRKNCNISQPYGSFDLQNPYSCKFQIQQNITAIFFL